ncbi:hypothetical protein NG796_24800 [Laspinema sp. A4]|uniref:hypothetical protein n=1 Tax=Laspinema sp. D2d TaxID=2953686 RepID=UPI0021BB22F2|nr:hypothetical protein [Laspinema sp. D2d]MCT7986496.1 hypothetical protein [Laspinema sp. D2d]
MHFNFIENLGDSQSFPDFYPDGKIFSLCYLAEGLHRLGSGIFQISTAWNSKGYRTQASSLILDSPYSDRLGLG